MTCAFTSHVAWQWSVEQRWQKEVVAAASYSVEESGRKKWGPLQRHAVKPHDQQVRPEIRPAIALYKNAEERNGRVFHFTYANY